MARTLWSETEGKATAEKMEGVSVSVLADMLGVLSAAVYKRWKKKHGDETHLRTGDTGRPTFIRMRHIQGLLREGEEDLLSEEFLGQARAGIQKHPS